MTNQEAFEIMCNHLRLQEWCRSEDVYGYCMYRGGKGRKCAVGVLISDEDYNPDMERKNVDSLFSCFPSVDNGCSIHLLEDMQMFHDKVMVSERLPNIDNLRRIGLEHELSVAFLKNF